MRWLRRRPEPDDGMARAEAAARRGDHAGALALWGPLAHAGNPRAQARVGACFAAGLGVARDPGLAVKWLTLAAEAGDPAGCRELAHAHFRGDGVPEDPRRAAALYRQAAEAGDAEAQDMLSWMLLEGEIIPPDPAEALRLARAAAAQGHAGAMSRLGMLHHNAIGVERDPAEAARWWARAAARRRRRRPGDARRRAPDRRRRRPRPGRRPHLAHPRPGRRQRARLPVPAPRRGRADPRGGRPRPPRRRRAAAGAGAMIVGTAGHIDHGKTSLVRALTGVDADRLKEEKARGITIDLGFAYMPAGDGVIGFVDVPGHERLVHNMLAGASGIDFALLVVAADDGPMPQTREHLAILDLLGLTRGLVALTKADLVDPDRLAAARNETANALIGTGLEGAEIVAVSSATGAGVAALRARLEAAAAERSARPAGAPFRLAVDRSFTLPGAGTVVTGTVLAGSVAPGDHLVASPSGLAVRVRGLHAQNRVAERGRPGDRCALNLAGDGVSKGALRRGDMIVAPALHAPTDRIDARLRVLASEARPIGQWLPVHLHHGAAEIAARVVLLGDPIAPGRRGPRPARPRPARRRRRRRPLRHPRHQRPAHHRRRRLPRPARPRPPPPHARAPRPARGPRHPRPRGRARRAPRPAAASPRPRRLRPRPRPRAGRPSPRRPDIVRIESRAGPLALSRATADRLGRALVATLEDFHAENPDLVGIGMERLRTSLEPRLPAPAFQALLQAEARAGRLALDGAWVRLAGHEVRLSPEDEVLWEEARPLIGGATRFRPPRVRDLAAELDLDEAEVRRLCKVLARMGRVHEVAHDHFFLRDAVGEMVVIAAELDASRRPVLGRAVPRPARQRPQGRHPDPRVP